MSGPSTRVRGRRLVRVAFAAFAALLLAPATASAHPLGNFTINHYSGLRVEPERVLVDHVVDYAEIPTFQERQAMDRAGDGDGTVSDAEVAAYRDAACQRQASELELVVTGGRVPLAVSAAAVLFPVGQAGASTLRLVCALRGVLPASIAGPSAVTFTDPTYPGRLGWREIVVQGDRTTIGGGAVGDSRSARLTVYPQDLLTEPLHQESIAFEVTPGGPALVPFTAPELQASAQPAVPGAAASPVPGVPVSPAAPAPTGAAQPTGAGGCTDVTAGLPGGTADFGRQICELVQAKDLTPVTVFVSLLAAAVIGAAHAVSPGHGKTVMAAYLVGARGGLRHAVGLGLTVTVSHTIGVLALGGLTIYASTLLPPDRLQLFLGVASGLILVGLGLYLVVSRVRSTRRERASRPLPPLSRFGSPALARAGASAGALPMVGGATALEPSHGAVHEHPHADEHEHAHAAEHEHAHAAEHEHAHAAEHEHTHSADRGHDHPHDHGDGDHDSAAVADDEATGWHSHGLFRHTHIPEKLPDGGLSWRALFALGLSGGLVPSASAVIVLLVSISLGRPAYGIVLTIAFGLGMAVVLIGIGLALVYARGLIERMPRRSTFGALMRYVPMATAVFVLVVGVAVTAQALGQVR